MPKSRSCSPAAQPCCDESNVYKPWEELRLMFIEMSRYRVPCPYKATLETNAVRGLLDCEDDLDPFSGNINY